MSEENKTELETLKERAEQMGISFHPAIGLEKLKEKVNEKLQGPVKEEVATGNSEADQINAIRKKASRLIRVNISPMNPAKRDWDGEIVTVGNAKIGTFRKFVKFNTDEGWHIPEIIYNALKARKFQTFFNDKTQNGVTKRATRLVNEFNIEVLPALTQEELDELAKAQAARG